MKYCILNPENEKKVYDRKIGEFSPFDVGIPLFDCSDTTLREIYYYRWHLYCKHIRKTPGGYVVTEFYPSVPWAKKYNTICCPAGHHLYEGRWLHNKNYVIDYAKFWFNDSDAKPRDYSFWAADAIWKYCEVIGDFSLAESLFEKLKENYAGWEETNMMHDGMFYQIDDRDGMEYSAGGSGRRPTINSYMYADALALSKIAERLGYEADVHIYRDKAETLKVLINKKLWDADAVFFKTLCDDDTLADVREEVGYVPWYFDIPDEEKSEAWKFLMDENYFAAPYGPTTTERCYPEFMKWFDHECLWNGPSWPFATSQTLTGLGNFLVNYKQNIMQKSDYYKILHTYAASQYDTLEDGSKVPYVDENLDPFTGEWIARKLLLEMENPPGGADRGADYNHSTYCDLILNGLVGIRTREDEMLHVCPLFNEADLGYMCADGILYHGHYLAVLWDVDGSHYGVGAGMQVFCDGVRVHQSERICEIKIELCGGTK